MFNSNEPNLWEFLNSLTLEVKFHPFRWYWTAGCNEWTTYVAVGPVGITLSYEV